MGDFDGAQTHNLHITSQTCNPLRHTTPKKDVFMLDLLFSSIVIIG